MDVSSLSQFGHIFRLAEIKDLTNSEEMVIKDTIWLLFFNREFFTEVEMDTHLKCAYHNLHLLLNYSTAFKKQITFPLYALLPNLPIKYFIISKEMHLYFYLLTLVYCIIHFDLLAQNSLSIRSCQLLMMWHSVVIELLL